jgi:hypothetical protein
MGRSGLVSLRSLVTAAQQRSLKYKTKGSQILAVFINTDIMMVLINNNVKKRQGRGGEGDD